MKSSPKPVITIDCDYLFPRFAASFLLVERHSAGNSAVFIETNTAYAVPRMLEELRRNHLTPEEVRYVIVTHAHLDHAGGASAVMKACPNAVLLAHPKAAGHLINPSKLVASARKVYGNQTFEKLYGVIEPIAASRVRAVEDGEQVAVGPVGAEGSRELVFLHTRGHANHHICVQDPAAEAIFTGDSFGLAYPDLQSKGLFIFPSTSPTGFEPDHALKTLERILASGAQRAFLTHYGEMASMIEAAQQLRGDLEFCGELMEQAAASSVEEGALPGFCEERLMNYYKSRVERLGLGGDSKVWDILKLDLKLNADGIAFSAKRKKGSL